MALQRLFGGSPERSQPEQGTDSYEDEFGFPTWVISSIIQFLAPFWHTEVSYDRAFLSRDFVREAERNLRLRLDWSRGHAGAAESLWKATYRDPERLVGLVDFALRNIRIGYEPRYCETAASELNRALHESGASWEVREVPDRLEYRLERRIDAATSSALTALSSEGTSDAQHLAEARRCAFGQHPDPGKAYDEAVKAVEAVAVPVVLPNDPTATLGKAIGAVRADPSRWTCTFARPTAQGQSSVEVVIAMLDMLWKNETDRHSPVVPITQAQAESAVHVAMTLVQLFRSGVFARA